MTHTLHLLLTTALVASTHSIFCSESRPYCPSGRTCVQGECRRYKTTSTDCNDTGQCPRGYCCMTMNVVSPYVGMCIRKPNFRLQLGDYCKRESGCDYCLCEPHLVCAKSGFQFLPGAIYTCQENNTEGVCTDDEQCASDRCCSGRKCKPKKREGEQCWPKNMGFWEAWMNCDSVCEDGTACTRDYSKTNPYYVCTPVGSNPNNTCR